MAIGRLLKAKGDRNGAITAYGEAVATLQTLRGDLVAVNPDVQFSFRETIEPLYREFADLLLQGNETTEGEQSDLLQARQVIEGLQIAELDNFFREACLETSFQLDQVIEQSNQATAVAYTMALPTRLEVILKLPQQPLRHYSTTVSQQEVENTVTTLLAELKQPYRSQQFQTLSQQLYRWLIQPAELMLADQGIETLVFVLDSSLQSIPMSTLYDGQQYLIETYRIALAPGLQLPDPQPLRQQPLRALVAGLSEAQGSFPPLTYVETEMQQIQTYVPSAVLLNQTFTRNNLQTAVNASPVPIIHIATHGQFSSNLENTFILTWDQVINANELSNLLRDRALNPASPIELLVLSACQTATGDRRATLGLAGVAIRAGARSTIASLWNLDDDSGALLMSQFYQELAQTPISKAEALRRAQVALLRNPQYEAPRFWAPYVLLGNWL